MIFSQSSTYATSIAEREINGLGTEKGETTHALVTCTIKQDQVTKNYHDVELKLKGLQIP